MMLIDSNMWCFYFDDSCREHAKVARALERVLATDEVLSNSMVVMEVSHFLVKNLGPRIGRAKIETLLSFPMRILDLDSRATRLAIEMRCDYSHVGIGGRDATLLTAMKLANAKRIMTNDGAFKKIDWLQVFDPLETGGKPKGQRSRR